MHLLLILLVGGLGSAASGFGLARGGRSARIGAVVGGLALLLLLALVLTLDAPAALQGGVDAGAADAPAGGVFDGHLLPTAYLKLTLGLWALDAVLLAFIAWLLGGLAHLRGVLPATLAAMTGGAVVFASADLAIGAAAATATGLAALIAVPPDRGRLAVATAARELRLTLAVGAVLLTVIAMAPLTAALTFGAADPAGGAAPGSGEAAAGAGAVLGLAALAVTLAVGARLGAIPFHLRFSRIADAATPIDLPLLLAWLAVPVGVAGLALVDGQVAPLALPFAGDRLIVVALAVLTLVAAALGAFLQDDLRHATAYLVIADGGLVLLGFAALDPAAWGPARVWLVAMAASKTALAAWAAVAEDRFGTRSIPDLRGWLRRSPILAAGLAVTVVATFGIPGWVAFDARGALARLTVEPPWETLLVLAGFLTLPTYLRLMALGVGPATSKVDGAAPDRIIRRRGQGVSLLRETLIVEVERPDGPAGGRPGGATAERTGETEAAVIGAAPASSAWRRLARRRSRAELTLAVAGGREAAFHRTTVLGRALQRDRTELLAAAVLALAVLAALTSWGALDIAGAAAEPAPIVSGPAAD
jgi:NADH:ubiquinone oxidoreductase subunit 2 (subunit N)